MVEGTRPGLTLPQGTSPTDPCNKVAVATTARRPCRSNTGAAAARRPGISVLSTCAPPAARTSRRIASRSTGALARSAARARRASASIAARSPKAKNTRPVAERSRGRTDPIASEVITGGLPGNQRTTVAPTSPHTARRQVRPVARANSVKAMSARAKTSSRAKAARPIRMAPASRSYNPEPGSCLAMPAAMRLLR
jgi:hypothetical protein